MLPSGPPKPLRPLFLNLLNGHNPVHVSPLPTPQGCRMWAETRLGALGPIFPSTGVSSNLNPGLGVGLRGEGLTLVCSEHQEEKGHGGATTPPPPGLTMLCEMVRQPYLTPHFLFCQTLRILGPRGRETQRPKAYT